MKRKFPFPIGCMLYTALGVLVIGSTGYFYLQHANYHSALEATREWARLNDFPSSAANLTVAAQGNMFARELTVEFDAPLEDLDKWLDESPGTKSVVPSMEGSVRRYNIQPGGGAQRVELELDENTGHVKINTYWS